MKGLCAIVLAAALVFPNCAARTRVAGPVQTNPEILRNYVKSLPIGSRVTVRFTDGSRLAAILMSADAERIVVKPATRLPEPEQTVNLANVEFVELAAQRPHKTVARAAAEGAAGVAAGIGVLWLLLWASYSY